jgi:hypothetical protein
VTVSDISARIEWAIVAFVGNFVRPFSPYELLAFTPWGTTGVRGPIATGSRMIAGGLRGGGGPLAGTIAGQTISDTGTKDEWEKVSR